jgi:hypothetical protein
MPVEAAHVVKAIMVDRYSSNCDDPVSGRVWYDRNVDVWDPAKLATHAPDGVRDVRAGLVLEGCPDGEGGPDCWGVEISSDPDVLSAIPGWYMECWACWLVLFYPRPTDEEMAQFRHPRARAERPRSATATPTASTTPLPSDQCTLGR